jgi:NAD(P)-dependent dehydrogenase (short-subunit alcohol dehydrogenase family)
MSDKLQNKIAVITGGNSGIGLATAKRFLEEGAEHVYITGRRQNELDEAVKSLGKNVTGIQGDVSKLADLDRLFSTVRARHGRVDVLFANAGGGEYLPLGKITEEHFDRYFGSNVKGVLFSVQKALPLMTSGASIVMNGSIVSIKGFPAFSVYSATKAAVRSFARTFATDLKGRGIRVNVVAPGPIRTPGANDLHDSVSSKEEVEAQMSAGIPLERIGEPDEIAKAVVFLASDDASFVNGVELFVDGGMAQI